MDLRSGTPLWTDQDGARFSYPALTSDAECDIAIVGGGVVGGLVAYHLAREGKRILLADKNSIGRGSTAASTALIIYPLDENLSDLTDKIGEEKAVRAYRAMYDSVDSIKNICSDIGAPGLYHPMKTLYLASKAEDVGDLRRECEALSRHDFSAEFLDAPELMHRFGIDSPAGIVSSHAGELDPYLFTEQLISYAHAQGALIYADTEIVSHAGQESGTILQCANGARITAQQVIFSTGYEAQEYFKKDIVKLVSSYVVASEPIKSLETHWLREYMVWETARPYLYLRTTDDNRILVGGEDIDAQSPELRDALIAAKTKILEGKFAKLVTDISFSPAYAWAGTFGETQDGMGYAGSFGELPGLLFALGYGGNGITFGNFAAQIVAAHAMGKFHKDADLAAFDRWKAYK